MDRDIPCKIYRGTQTNIEEQLETKKGMYLWLKRRLLSQAFPTKKKDIPFSFLIFFFFKRLGLITLFTRTTRKEMLKLLAQQTYNEEYKHRNTREGRTGETKNKKKYKKLLE